VFNVFWNEMQKEWLKVETLQDYSGEEEFPSLQVWLSGDKGRALALMEGESSESEWGRMLKSKNVTKTRIHIVQKPYSPYLEWELEAYRRTNIPAGEKIYIVNSESVVPLQIPDFFIFDNERAIESKYDSSGRVESMNIYDRGENIEKFLNYKKELLKVAEPFR